MATKKQAPKKATAKVVKPAKPAAKAPAKKAAATTNVKTAAKKAAPASKKTAAPVKKAAPKSAPAPKKAAPVAKKAAKPEPKVIAKKAAAPVKKMAEPAPKKPAPAKAAPTKAVQPEKKTTVTAPTHQEVKPAIKPLEKPSSSAAKPAAKAAPAKPAKVVIPKTTTTNSVKYEPEFTKSVLDKNNNNQQEPVGPTMRYSDAELQEFRDLINKKLDTAKKELAYLQGLITRRDESGDLDEGRYMTMEDGSMSMEREQLSQMASRQIQFIDHLEKAIMRIENKTYGVCRVTGKLIDKARLRAVPHATLSIEAKQMMNK